MAAFKPAYLIHGDDHGRIAERRARLRRLAEAESGAQGLELLEGEAATPEAVAASLNAMTFAIGRRFIVVDGVERWKEKDLEPLEAALRAIPPDTTIAFFAREDNRTKAPGRLHDAIKTAGGDIAAEETVKPWELPKWVMAQARELGLRLEPDGARALIAHVGDRQQRLLRELEKLVLSAGPGSQIDVARIEVETAPSAERRAWSLADALVGGDPAEATAIYLALRSQGERLPGLIYSMAGASAHGDRRGSIARGGGVGGADKAPPPHALPGRRPADRGRAPERKRTPAPDASADRRPRARLTGRRQGRHERGHRGSARAGPDRRLKTPGRPPMGALRRADTQSAPRTIRSASTIPISKSAPSTRPTHPT